MLRSMATYYLLTTTKLGVNEYKSGKLIDSALTDVVALAAAGGALVVSTNAVVAAAALVVQEMWKQGKAREECDSYMMLAYSASKDVVDNTSTVYYGKVLYSKPLLSELISVVADIQMANGPLGLLTQPNVPSRLNVRLVCAGGISAGIVTLLGFGADGAPVTQAIPLTGVTRTVVTDEAFATLTSATLSALAGGAAGDHISIGVSDYLGLPVPAAATALTVFKETLDYANEAVGTVHAASRSISPSHAADGTHEFEFWYKYTLAHTHTLS